MFNLKKAVPELSAAPEEEYIWVEGYKATNFDYSAKHGNITYEINKLYEPVSLCIKGFHFCLNPKFISQYYSIGRLFKVRALVSKKEYDKFNAEGYYFNYLYTDTTNKMVARAIILTEEIADIETLKLAFDTGLPSLCESYEDYIDFVNFSNQNTKSNKNSKKAWDYSKFIPKMIENGFSETIANIIFADQPNLSRILELVQGLNEMGCSTDMKIYLTLKEANNLTK
jgi:hypothetical protein